ncbi:hypothetical protein [uncultured Sulfitobacter sp.]|uniref:hypothetical protein n=1 Tax=uncultured Sulfitobacter sp. TaxID=191468 RepID=UPI00261762D6|nr:hypothetical protein [uncultured Sulfitobacter sp.]
MSINVDKLDYDFQDKSLANIAEALRGLQGKFVAHDKVDSVQKIVETVERELKQAEQGRIDYVAEMNDLKARQKELDDDKSSRYSSLENQPVRRERTPEIMALGITGVIVFAVAKGAGWYGFLAFIVAAVAGLIAYALAESLISTPKFIQAQEDHMMAMRQRQAQGREDQFKNPEILTGKAFQRELSRIQSVLENMKASLANGVTKYMENKTDAVTQIIRLSHLDVSIEADEFNPDTRGAPVIKWEGSRLTMPDISDVADITADTFSEGGYGKFTSLVAQEEIGVTLSIYINEGRLVERDFDQHCTKIYSDTLTPDGEFAHTEAPTGKTYNYYVVTKIEFFAYRKEGDRLIPYGSAQEITNGHARIKIKAFRSDEEVLEDEIKDHTVKAKRAKFHEKIGKSDKTEGTSPGDLKSKILAEKIEAHKRRTQIEEETIDLRKSLTEAGLPEEEIEEAIDEYIQSI